LLFERGRKVLCNPADYRFMVVPGAGQKNEKTMFVLAHRRAGALKFEKLTVIPLACGGSAFAMVPEKRFDILPRRRRGHWT
jgi:hypothetical protein